MSLHSESIPDLNKILLRDSPKRRSRTSSSSVASSSYSSDSSHDDSYHNQSSDYSSNSSSNFGRSRRSRGSNKGSGSSLDSTNSRSNRSFSDEEEESQKKRRCMMITFIMVFILAVVVAGTVWVAYKYECFGTSSSDSAKAGGKRDQKNKLKNTNTNPSKDKKKGNESDLLKKHKGKSIKSIDGGITMNEKSEPINIKMKKRETEPPNHDFEKPIMPVQESYVGPFSEPKTDTGISSEAEADTTESITAAPQKLQQPTPVRNEPQETQRPAKFLEPGNGPGRDDNSNPVDSSVLDPESSDLQTSLRSESAKPLSPAEISRVDDLLSYLDNEIASQEYQLTEELGLNNAYNAYDVYSYNISNQYDSSFRSSLSDSQTRGILNKIKFAEDPRQVIREIEMDLPTSTSDSSLNSGSFKSTFFGSRLRTVRTIIIFTLMFFLFLGMMIFLCCCSTPEAFELNVFKKVETTGTSPNLAFKDDANKAISNANKNAQVVPIHIAQETDGATRFFRGWNKFSEEPVTNQTPSNNKVNRNQFGCLTTSIVLLCIFFIFCLGIASISGHKGKRSKEFNLKRLAAGLNNLQKDHNQASYLKKQIISVTNTENNNSDDYAKNTVALRKYYNDLGHRYPEILRPEALETFSNLFGGSAVNSEETRSDGLGYFNYLSRTSSTTNSSSNSTLLSRRHNPRYNSYYNGPGNYSYSPKRTRSFNRARFLLYLLIFIISLTFFFLSCSNIINFHTHTFQTEAGFRHNFTYRADDNYDQTGIIPANGQLSPSVSTGEGPKVYEIPFFKEIDGHLVGRNITPGDGFSKVKRGIQVFCLIIGFISLGLMVLEVRKVSWWTW